MSYFLENRQKSQKLTLIFQNLSFIAFLHYDFQKPAGVQEPMAPMVKRPLFKYQSLYSLNFLSLTL